MIGSRINLFDIYQKPSDFKLNHSCPRGQLAPQAHLKNTVVDGIGKLPQHGFKMGDSEYEKPRRSARMFMRVRVMASGKNSEGRRFREACETIVINAHGGLLYLDQPLENGLLIELVNPFTQEEQECRVVFLGEANEKGQRVGVEFLSPAPRFWGVDFSPAKVVAPEEPARPN